MFSREKIIKGLECCADDYSCHDCPYRPIPVCSQILADNALELLKQQEPITPIIVCDEYECGECRYELKPNEHTYCPCCGRKVKWE